MIQRPSLARLTRSLGSPEVYTKTMRVEREGLAEKQRAFIKERSALVPLDEATAIESAKIDVEMKKKVRGWG
ncbi:MAG: hypothetical protein ACUVTL_06715 [Thermoproteota archaeon]